MTVAFEWGSTSGRRGEVAVAKVPVKNREDFNCRGDKLSVSIVQRILRSINAGQTEGTFERYEWKIAPAPQNGVTI